MDGYVITKRGCKKRMQFKGSNDRKFAKLRISTEIIYFQNIEALERSVPFFDIPHFTLFCNCPLQEGYNLRSGADRIRSKFCFGNTGGHVVHHRPGNCLAVVCVRGYIIKYS